MTGRCKSVGLALLMLLAIGGRTPAAQKHIQALDPHHLPLGDGKISNAPRRGYVFACAHFFRRARGAAAALPWIDGRTWDETEKPHVEGRLFWPEARLRIATQGSLRIVTGDGLPVATPTGRFPIAPDDPAFRYDRNPNTIRAVDFDWRLPRDPRLAARPSCVPMGPIGIALNGVLIFNALDAAGRDAAAHEVQDLCNGHPQHEGLYHYHGPSPCLAAERGRNRLIGYALDGFGITSMYDASGREIADADLDSCHGRIDSIRWDGRQVRMYHYVLTREYPYTIGCFRGTPLHIARQPRGPRFGPPP